MSIDLKSGKVGSYTIEGKISSGSMGIVYRVEKNSKHYALKIPMITNVESIHRFRKESASIARLNHPCLVQLVDANELEGTPYIIMELLEGRGLEELINTDGPLPMDLFMKVAKSLTSGLGEMHKCGIIHRDIKPMNVIITHSQDVKLLDLGLAGENLDLREEDQKTVVGTILYASPEQCKMLKRPVDSRSDLYSLGVTLFKCLTGVCPFHSENLGELMKMHASVTAPDVREKAPDTSPVVAAVISKLLAKDPDDRYQSADGLLYDLETCSDLEVSWRGTGTIRLGARDQLLESGSNLAFAGRERELEVLRSYWNDVCSEKGRVVIVQGESGSGKSRLTRELIEITANDHLVLRAKCQELSSQIPLAPIREAIESLLSKIKGISGESRRLWVNRIQTSAAGYAASVNELSIGFKEYLGEPKEKSPQDEFSRQRYFEDLAEFFSKLSTHFSGAILLIDDVQWTDPSTQELLCKLGERVKSHKLMILMTARNDAASASVLNQFIETMGDCLESPIILGPLSQAAASTMISALLGKSSLDVDTIQRINRASNGNPFVIGEYIRNLLNMGFLAFRDGQWRINSEGISQVSISSDIFQLILNRINLMTEQAKTVLGIASVIGNTFELAPLVASMNLTDTEVIRHLQEAIQYNLISVIEGGSFRFTHDKIRESLKLSMTDERRRNVNDALARFTDDVTGNKRSWYDLARYLANGNFDKNLKRTCEVNYEAGKLALANYSYQQAYELIRFALECAKRFELDVSSIKEINRHFALACNNSGHEQEAHLAIDYAISLASSREETIGLLYVKLQAYYNFGRINHAWVLFKQVIDSLGVPYPQYEFLRWMKINWNLLTASLRLITGFRFGSARHKPKKRKYLETLSEVYTLGILVSRWKSGNHGLLITLQELNISYQLGPGPLFAKALCYAVIPASQYRLRGLAQFLLSLAAKMTDSTDLATQTYVKYSELLYANIFNDSKIEKLSAEIEQDVTRYLGPTEHSQWATTLPWKYFNDGRHYEALCLLQSRLPKVRSLGQKLLTAYVLSPMPLHMVQLGDISGAVEANKVLAKAVDADLKDYVAIVNHYVLYQLYMACEEREFGNDVNMQIDYLRHFRFLDYHRVLHEANIGYIRLAQLELAHTDEERRRSRLELKQFLRSYDFRAFSPLARCHWFVIKAGLARAEMKFLRSLKYADRGYQLAKDSNCPVAIYRSCSERAATFQAINDPHKTNMEAGYCFSMAVQHRWQLRATGIQERFKIAAPLGGLSDVAVNTTRNETSSQPMTRSVGRFPFKDTISARNTLQHTDNAVTQTQFGDGSSHLISGKTILQGRPFGQTFDLNGRIGTHASSKTNAVTKEERLLAALIQVAVASTVSNNPIVQSKAVLYEVIKLFGAERAFLFLSEDNCEKGLSINQNSDAA